MREDRTFGQRVPASGNARAIRAWLTSTNAGRGWMFDALGGSGEAAHGALSARGMIGFASEVSAEEAEAVRACVIERAHRTLQPRR